MGSARWTNGILAIWLAISAFLGFTVVGNILNLVTIGSFVAGIGLAIAGDSKWQGRTATAAGLWLIAAPALPVLRSGSGFLWNSLIIAAVILVTAVPFRAGRRTGRQGHDTIGRPTSSEGGTRPEPARAWSDDAGRSRRELAHR